MVRLLCISEGFGSDIRGPAWAPLTPTPCVQLCILRTLVREAFESESSLRMWPLQDPRVAESVLATEALAAAGLLGCTRARRWWMRILYFLRICTHSVGGPLFLLLRDLYGPTTAFSFKWAHCYVQALWVLAPWASLFLCLGVRPFDTGPGRVQWEIFKAGVVVWCAGTGLSMWWHFRHQPPARLPMVSIDTLEHRPAFPSHERVWSSRIKRHAKLLFIGWPSVLLFIALINFTFTGFTQLILYFRYTWDPDKTQELWTQLILTACDFSFAILLELYLPLGSALATWMATLSDHRSALDFAFVIEISTLVVAAMEKVVFFAVLAFQFVPEWEESTGAEDLGRDCSHLLLGDYSIACLRLRLPFKRRQDIFESLMVGPFLISPFMKIFVRTGVPLLIRNWEFLSRQLFGKGLMRKVTNTLTRLLLAMFVSDWTKLGGIRFLWRGWPFEVIAFKDNEAAGKWQEESMPMQHCFSCFTCCKKPSAVQKPEMMVESTLRHYVRKVFDPKDELLELAESFMQMAFFGQVLPMGVLCVLLAQFLETKADLAKMLLVRRRSFPEPDGVPRATQSAFACAVLLAAVAWSVGLSLLTYNRDLWRWSLELQWLVLLSVLLGFFLSGLLAWKWLVISRLRR
ncbi:unnamed protein product [Polarella glacialis]|uniref:Anoctamin transmembrane domain-containing protein n=1 Tax=Polarella glacialis TaxID=89957 RepID=A0A813GGS5_POLGL|nr:unnamed protein product [Polarella glacialis]